MSSQMHYECAKCRFSHTGLILRKALPDKLPAKYELLVLDIALHLAIADSIHDSAEQNPKSKLHLAYAFQAARISNSVALATGRTWRFSRCISTSP